LLTFVKVCCSIGSNHQDLMFVATSILLKWFFALFQIEPIE
jgi:hypothetical protein